MLREWWSVAFSAALGPWDTAGGSGGGVRVAMVRARGRWRVVSTLLVLSLLHHQYTCRCVGVAVGVRGCLVVVAVKGGAAVPILTSPSPVSPSMKPEESDWALLERHRPTLTPGADLLLPPPPPPLP